MIRHLTLCTLLLIGAGFLTAEEKPADVKPAVASETPKVERLKPDQWCATHDIPKNVCAACDRKLIPGLKKAKDWCPEHDIAESVCTKCDPAAKGRLDALRPTEKPAVAQ